MSEHSGKRGAALSEGDQLALMFIIPLALMAALGSAAVWWSKAVGWLVGHAILVPASASPLITLPASDGAGLDGRRAVIAVVIVGIVITLAVSAAKGALHARRDERLRRGGGSR